MNKSQFSHLFEQLESIKREVFSSKNTSESVEDQFTAVSKSYKVGKSFTFL